MKGLFYIFGIVTLLSCETKNTTNIPISEYAASWVPSNQDSVLFAEMNTNDTAYLSYSGYTRQYLTVNENAREQIAQRAFSSDSGFSLNYLLQGGRPDQDSAGRPIKTDVLRLNSPLSLRSMDISNQIITTNLLVIDSLMLPDSTVYRNVLTDSASYFFTENNDIIMYNNGAAWYYKSN